MYAFKTDFFMISNMIKKINEKIHNERNLKIT